MSICRCVAGVVVEAGTREPQPGVTVRLATRAARGFNPVASAVTDGSGRFSIDLGTFRVGGATGTRYVLTVDRGGEEIPVTGDTTWSEGQDTDQLVLCVSSPKGCGEESSGCGRCANDACAISGQIRHVDGTALSGLTVELRRVALPGLDGGPTTLHTMVTGSNGRYALPCPDGAADLQVCVFGPALGELPGVLLASSAVLWKHIGSASIDVVICSDAYRGPSEYARINADVTVGTTWPAGGPGALGVDGAAYLSGRSGWPLDRVVDWILAARFHVDLQVDAEPLYGLFREGAPQTEQALLARPPAVLRRALVRAVRRNIISSAVDIEAAVQALSMARAAAMIDADHDDAASLGAILRTSAVLGQPNGLNDLEVAEFCILYASWTGTSAGFWSEVSRLSAFSVDGSAVGEASRLLSLGLIGLGWAPCVTAILRRLGTAPASDAGGWTLAAWEGVAGVTDDGLPPVASLPLGLDGPTPDAQRETLARIMFEHAQATFPRQAIARGLAAVSSGPLLASARFFSLNPDIDLETEKFRSGGGYDFGTDDPVATLDNLRLTQRLYRVAPESNVLAAMTTLATKGYQSARSVARKGRSRFIADYAGTTDTDSDAYQEAVEIYQKATSQSAMAAAFVLQAHPSLSRLSVPFVADDPAILSSVTDEQFPGFSSLFSSSGGCRCEWCRSIHGPAAYLVDLLDWLGGKASSTGTTALQVLSARRPDIQHLSLTCDNTTRVLPYIDLSLEILESVVAEEAPSARDTLVDTPDLLAAPQYVNETAYDADHLGGYPRALKTPFHRPLAEMRAFLTHLGIDRTDLMRAYQTETAISDTVIAVEELGLSSEGAALVSNAGTPPPEADCWAVGALSDLPTVTAFRRAAEMTHSEILDLLWTRAANVDRNLEVVFTGDDAYDSDDYAVGRWSSGTLVAPSSGQWTRLRQVIRLWKASGWSLLDLDKVVVGMDDATPEDWSSGDVLLHAGGIHRLARMTGFGPVELVSWFSAIDTWTDRDTKDDPIPSLYDQTYLSPSLFSDSERNEVDGSGYHTFPFALNSDRSDVDLDSLDALGTQALAGHLTRLHAVLQIDESEVTDLIAALSGSLTTYDPGTGDVPNVTLANLSLLYRWASLGRAVRLRPTDAVTLKMICGIDPFASAEDAANFLDEAAELAAAGWSVDEVDYLLRDGATDRVAPTDDYLRSALGRLRDAIRSAYATTGGGVSLATLADDIGRRLAESLASDRTVLTELRARTWPNLPSLPAGTITLPGNDYASVVATGATMTLPAGTQVTLSVERADFGGSTTVEAGTVLTLSAALTIDIGAEDAFAVAAKTSYELGSPSTTLPDATATLRGGDAGSDTTLPASTDVLLPDGTSGHFTGDATVRPAADTTVTTSTALTLGPPAGFVATDPLLRYLRDDYRADGATTDGDPWSDLTRETFEDDYSVLEAMLKAVTLARKLGVDLDERAAWYAQVEGSDPTLDLFDPATLDDADITGSGDPYAAFKRTVDLFALRKRLPGTAPTFADVVNEFGAQLAGTVGADPAGLIAERTDWDTSAVGTLWGWVTGPDVDGLKDFFDRMEATRRSGASPTVVLTWAAEGSLTGTTADASAAVVSAARSRYADPDAWGSVARPVRDRVRKAQRDALVSYLLAREADDALATADDLYEKLLIDVSMNPELLISRVVQATNSVQLFVHRCLFGLELYPYGDDAGDAVGDWFTDDDRAEWEWMRTYRIWEAARKVFLYPENWIEPELRDDKTPFFRTLEKELSQGDVNADRVETALLDYLGRLHDVASLKILATYVQKETDDDGTIDELHVFARTQSDPPTYWYRRREDSSTWTAWEKVDAGIQGEQLIPVVYNRRLLLFWAEFTESQADDENASPATWWDIRLAMSEYRDGAWSPKRVSSDPLSLSQSALVSRHFNYTAAYKYGFTPALDEEGGVLTITCFATSQDSALGAYTNFYVLGSFSLDPCTLEIEASPNYELDTSQVDTSAQRSALDLNYWWAPGFWTHDPSGGTEHLSVNRGETSEDGEPTGSYSPVEVLSTLHDATVVVPSQWEDFVSQSPFFVNVGNRAYFVDAGGGDATSDATLQSGQDLQGAPIESSVTVPSVGALGASRAGTYSDNEPDASMTEADAALVSLYLSDTTYATTQLAVSAVQSANAVLVSSSVGTTLTGTVGDYTFYNFYHPHVCRFIKEVRRNGAFGLLNPDPGGTAGDLFRQALVGDTSGDFEVNYRPTSEVSTPYPSEDIDFSESGAYSQYNWELFFHVPYYVATRLMNEGQFQDALDWMHCVFDPRTRTSAGDGAADGAQWWKVSPFLEAATAPVQDWITFSGADGDADQQAAFEAQVAAWRDDPFNPHLLARLRPGTYQKAFVMRYLDVLLAWGDALFTKDTLETINEATQLYVFAKRVLGDKPEQLESPSVETPRSYAELGPHLDGFGNALVAVENVSFSATGSGPGSGATGSGMTAGLSASTYFCVPANAELLSYWDTVEDRLFKIRNGMNIEGVVRSLPLFQPPIDPALLVRAAAAGIDIGSAADGLTAALPLHRFSVVLSRAQALAGSVRSLGQAVLAAVEKNDAEGLALLRQSNEEALLDAVRDVKRASVEEAKRNLDAAKRQRSGAQARFEYYQRQIDDGWLGEESDAAHHLKWAVRLNATSSAISSISGILAWFPQVQVGVASGAATGGISAANALGADAGALASIAGSLSMESGRLNTVASYRRRKTEWKFQRGQAQHELKQLDSQILAAEVRLDIAKRDLANQELQIAQSAQVRAFMEQKFSRKDLYDWMVGELASLHFQTYQLALSLAKKAEACYRFELGPDERADGFVQPVYWDSLRKGLLAGDRLAADLERMDAAYLEKDVREYELTEHVSLLLLDPFALERLRAEGVCDFLVSEAWLDRQTGVQDFRRIQSVAVSVSCVTGPLGTVHAKLTMESSYLRTSASGTLDLEAYTGTPSIVTSGASNDSGLFQTDLKDPRYLPFERRGAVSLWHLELLADDGVQLNWSTVEDVTLHLRYTARDSSRTAAAAASTASIGFDSSTDADPLTSGFVRVVSARRDLPDAFAAAQVAHASNMAFTVTSDMLAPATGTPTAVYVVPDGATTTTCDFGSEMGISPVPVGGISVYSVSVPADFVAGGTLGFGSGETFDTLNDVLVIYVYA